MEEQNTQAPQAPQTPAASDQNEKVMAALATIPLVGLIIYFAMPDSSAYVKNYAKQGTVLLVAGLVNTVVAFIPILNIISCFISLGILVAWVILLINALQENKMYKLPVVGEFGDTLLK